MHPYAPPKRTMTAMKRTFLLLLLFTAASAARTPERLSTGRPSPSYWQQHVDYTVEAELHPERRTLTGRADILYHNNSPDTLRTLVWHLYQNVFRKDSSPRKNDDASARAYGVTEGITVSDVTVNGAAVRTEVDETVMETPLESPILPGTAARVTVRWSYDIPKNADLRTGSDGDDFGLCQWYPQIAVYDDVRGWDRSQYLGIAEFYTEYGNWNASLTLPAEYIVAATGVLASPETVLTPEQHRRYAAVSDDSVIAVIAVDETGAARDTLKGRTRTWTFTADTVRDFAWAASPDFVWDATRTGDGTMIHAFYKPEDRRASLPPLIDDAENWDRGALLAKRTIEFFSRRFGPYAYPQATVVSGPVRGMEYPMMVFIEDGDAVTNGLAITIVHELGHQWYPMMVGSDETSHPFMDEGFTTYITSAMLQEEYGDASVFNRDFAARYAWTGFPEHGDRLFQQRFYLQEARDRRGASLLAHPYDIPQNEYGVMAYMKPGSVMVMLEDVLGTETFLAAMREYHRRWRFRHPLPDDFFNTVEDAAQRDLDWFWHQWFQETWRLDIALTGFANEERGGRRSVRLFLENREQAKMPATVRLSFADGSHRDVRFSERVWDRGMTAAVTFDSLPAAVTGAVVDPDMMLTDVDRLNNASSFPVSFDIGVGLMNQLLYPLDSYRVNAAPSVGFNLRDGFELGARIGGSYMAADHRTSLSVHQGTRSGVPDVELSYATPLRVWDPDLTTALRFFRLDGFTGWEWKIEKSFTDRKKLTRSYSRTFVISTGILSLRVNDDRYLADPAEWDRTGVLESGFIGLRYIDTFSGGRFQFRLEDEFGAPTGDFRYSKLTMESKLQHPFIAGMTMHWRLFAGTSAGAVPRQTAYTLSGPSPVERFDRWMFRTPVFGASGRRRLSMPGGGNMFLDADAAAKDVAAVNVALSRGPFLLFADAGIARDSSGARYRRPAFDAGFGLQFSLPGIDIGGLGTEGIGLGLFFPVWVKDPARPADDAFDLRWRVVTGVRL